MRVLTWNVNGLRAAGRNGFFDWLMKDSPDVVCLQETKCREDQLEEEQLSPLGYRSYFHSAEKAGYSGVAIYTKEAPKSVENMGLDEFDREGRVIVADYDSFLLINAYFPNSSRDHSRLGYKLKFCEAMLKFCKSNVKKGRNLILCGDYNIAHKPIDLKNPKSNEKNAGFLPEERAWMDTFTNSGFVDGFRHFEKGPDHYTWWSYRPGVRQRNIGWRLDYHCVNEGFLKKVDSVEIHSDIGGSDHCPVEINVKM